LHTNWGSAISGIRAMAILDHFCPRLPVSASVIAQLEYLHDVPRTRNTVDPFSHIGGYAEGLTAAIHRL
jgi:hypothetical protein